MRAAVALSLPALALPHGAVVHPAPRQRIDSDQLPWAGPVPANPPGVAPEAPPHPHACANGVGVRHAEQRNDGGRRHSEAARLWPALRLCGGEQGEHRKDLGETHWSEAVRPPTSPSPAPSVWSGRTSYTPASRSG